MKILGLLLLIILLGITITWFRFIFWVVDHIKAKNNMKVKTTRKGTTITLSDEDYAIH